MTAVDCRADAPRRARAHIGRRRPQPCRARSASRARLRGRRSRPSPSSSAIRLSNLPSSTKRCAVTMRLTLRRAQRRFEAGRARREIQHGRHAAVGRDGEEGDDGAGAGRQHDADRFAGLRALLQRMAQRERGPDDLVIGEHPLVAVDDGRSARRRSWLRASISARNTGLWARDRSKGRTASPGAAATVARLTWGSRQRAAKRGSWLWRQIKPPQMPVKARRNRVIFRSTASM